MNKDLIKEILYIFIAVIISIIAVKLFIWLLPIILIAILALIIYSSIKNKKGKKVYENKKGIKIIDAKDNND